MISAKSQTFESPKEFVEHQTSTRKANPKCNWGAKWASDEDRSVGMMTVRRGFRTLGVTSRVSVEAGLEDAFDSYARIESGAVDAQIREDAMRLLRLVA
jgi:hypothetical protein